ncbi:uromodulin-like [Centropristis striata]|uniref:uromodulin-like n=1 Tax=Centropristis striata TaxID=184440 RepID=UPI0027E20470|nr:uromodulin-like [Centropristis striata]
MEIFFDGFNALVIGHSNDEEGLCAKKALTLLTAKSSNYSAASCDDPGNSLYDPKIDCNNQAPRCDVLLQSPFTSCHAHIRPEHYVSSCNRTMCSYPAVDEVNCQFFNAYAKACSMILANTPGWKSNTMCSGEAFCQDKYCSDHEFCGEKKFGGTRCFCRAIFASTYKPTNTFGEPTVCEENSATVSLAECLLVDHGTNYSKLHLNDPTCTGDYDEQSHMVSFSFSSSNLCGTETVKNNSQLIYKNSIMTRNASAHEVIVRHDQIQLDFSCYYVQPERKSVSFKIKDSSVVETIVSGIWNYTLNMSAYTDPRLMERIGPNTEIRLNQKVWVELKTMGLDENLLDIVTDSCWATSQPSPTGPRYDIIKDGCPNAADGTVSLQGNGVGLSNSFSFNMFEFIGGGNDIYLHCLVELCVKNGPACVPTCGGSKRRRSVRSASADRNPALITMAWNNNRLL